PVFREVTSQSLRLLDVAPDQPVTPTPRKSTVSADQLADFVQMSVEEENALPAGSDGSILVARWAPAPREGEAHLREGGAPVKLRVTELTAPNLAGFTLREAFAKASSLGLELDPQGAGVVVRQSPPAGAPMEQGGTMRLELGRRAVTAR